MRLLKIPYSRSAAPLEIMKWLPPGKPITFLDIGASVGIFSWSICGAYQIEKGILVEPVPKSVRVLEERFPDKEIFKILNVAVSDSNAETDFYFNDEFDSISSLLKIYNDTDELKSLKIKEPISTKIKTLTLDHISAEYKLAGIDLIKIDVQGAEHLVLKSGIETLKRTKLVFTEFSFKPLYENSSVFTDLYTFFYENGFVLVDISRGYASSSGELLQGDALFMNKKFMV